MSESTIALERPFFDVRREGDGFSIPELKWRELLFVGALRARGELFERDGSCPLPPFEDPDLFPEDRLFSVERRGKRVLIQPLPSH